MEHPTRQDIAFLLLLFLFLISVNTAARRESRRGEREREMNGAVQTKYKKRESHHQGLGGESREKREILISCTPLVVACQNLKTLKYLVEV